MSGGEIALFHLVTSLDRTRYVPIVVLASEGPLVEKLRAAGVETHVLPIAPSVVQTRKDTLNWRGLANLRNIAYSLGYAVRLARFARKRHVDLIHTNSLKSDIYGGVAGRLARLPVIWHVRDHIESPYLPRPMVLAFRFLARLLPTAVITNSKSTLRRLHPSKRQRVAVAYSGVPAPSFDAPPVSDQPATIALIGRIAPWKGQHIFLDAAAQIHSDYPEARFWIIGAPLFGEQEYEGRLREQVARLGMEESVTFLGFRDDITALLTQIDLLVHASIEDEPFGQVVVQAMAAGRPVIATDGGGIPEVVLPEETGMLVPKGDVDALAWALRTLLSEPACARAMGRAGQRRVREHFTLSDTVRVVQDVYASVST